MSKFFFEYDIKNLKNIGENINDKFMFFIEKNFENEKNDFKYQLSLVIKREYIIDKETEKLIAQTYPNPKLKYLHILHDSQLGEKPIYSVIKATDLKYSSIGNPITMVDENGRDINNKYRYIKYEYRGLDEQDITGFGTFGFSEFPDREPLLENRYQYYCNFYKKKDIFYSFHLNKNKLNLNIYPINIDQDLKFRISYSQNPTYRNQNFLPNEITVSKKKNKKIFVEKITLNVDASYFRLVFSDEKMNRFFYLNNVDYIKKNTKEEVLSKNVGTNNICPFCLKKINNLVLNNIRNAGHDGKALSCNGDVSKNSSVRDSSGDVKDRNVVYCDSYYYDKSMLLEKMVIPSHYFDKRNVLVSILGLPASGKSVFISSLFGLQNGKTSDLSYFNGWMKKFGLNFRLETPYTLGFEDSNYYAVNHFKHQTYIPLVDREYGYDEKFLSSDIYEEYKINREKANFLRTSDETKFLPFILSSDQTNIVMYDIAGEHAEVERVLTADEDNNSENRTARINAANGFIVLISPQDSSFRDTIRRIISAKNINKDKPIAIVLSKFDLVNKANFDPNCAVLRDEIGSLFDNTYSNSNLKLNIDNASEEIKAYISENLSEFPMEDLNGFTNVKFFALSSLGDEKCVAKSSGDTSSSIMFYNTPFRLELPLIWILYHTGVIG